MVEKDYYKNGWAKRAQELGGKDLVSPKQVLSMQEMLISCDKENGVLVKELIRLKISDGLVEGLNDGQLAAFIRIVEFINGGSPEAAGIVLKGYAGTGKTFVIRRIVEYITTAYSKGRIGITAPTNKAVHVLSKNAPFADQSNIFETYGKPKERIVYSTIHKLLGLRESINGSTGIQTFVAGENIDITEYKYLIVDEVSMLSDELFLTLMDFRDKIKLIFMGDPAQIPPIGKEHALPFTDECPYALERLELTEIMRQKQNNPIVAASMILRDNLQKMQPLPPKTQLNKEAQGIIRFDASTKERKRVRDIIKTYFLDPRFEANSDYIRVIAWQNKTVKACNSIIRDYLFGDKKDTFNVGDRVIANKPLFARKDAKKSYRRSYGPNYAIKANTSDEFTIVSLAKVHRSLYDQGKGGASISFDGYFWELNVLDADKKEEVLYVIHKDSVADFTKVLTETHKRAQLLRTSNHWAAYYNMLKWSDNVNYNYAITAHKSQGSTYENVILIEEDLDKNPNVVERNRIKYTAYTRASNRMYVLR